MGKRKPKEPIAYTDTQLVYCAKCAEEIDLLAEGTMQTNWLPFGPIDDIHDLPQKRCDRCDEVFGEVAHRRRGRKSA